jgi:hypothetical protein
VTQAEWESWLLERKAGQGALVRRFRYAGVISSEGKTSLDNQKLGIEISHIVGSTSACRWFDLAFAFPQARYIMQRSPSHPLSIVSTQQRFIQGEAFPRSRLFSDQTYAAMDTTARSSSTMSTRSGDGQKFAFVNTARPLGPPARPHVWSSSLRVPFIIVERANPPMSRTSPTRSSQPTSTPQDYIHRASSWRPHVTIHPVISHKVDYVSAYNICIEDSHCFESWPTRIID